MDSSSIKKKAPSNRPSAVLAGAFACTVVAQWLFWNECLSLSRAYDDFAGGLPNLTMLFLKLCNPLWLIIVTGTCMVSALKLFVLMTNSRQRWMVVWAYGTFWAVFYATGYFSFLLAFWKVDGTIG